MHERAMPLRSARETVSDHRAPARGLRRGATALAAPTALLMATLAASCPPPRAEVPAPADSARARSAAGGETERPSAAPTTRAARALPALGLTAAPGALARADLGDLEAILAAAPDD